MGTSNNWGGSLRWTSIPCRGCIAYQLSTHPCKSTCELQGSNSWMHFTDISKKNRTNVKTEIKRLIISNQDSTKFISQTRTKSRHGSCQPKYEIFIPPYNTVLHGIKFRVLARDFSVSGRHACAACRHA
jgi:hypothetical protein